MNTNDLISRQYTIKRFGEDGTWLERQGVTTLTMVEAKQRAVDILESLPSEDRPKGDWRYDAVKGLDDFTKAFCRDYSVTDDLEFRCRECEFEMPDGRCLIKVIAHEICPDYKNFGSMGDH